MFCNQPLAGEYYFSRQEMVAGLNFSTDGKSPSFYCNGAASSNATIVLLVERDALKPKSDRGAGNDFTITFTPTGKSISINFRCAFFF